MGNNYKIADAKIGYALILAPIFEEILFRGFFLFAFLKIFNNKALSIFLSSLLFGLTHTPFYKSLWAFSIGVFLCIELLKTQNIIYPMLSHLTINICSLYII